MLPAMWGGIITGIGYGMVLRAGANTGGSDTIGQIISRNTSLPVGSTVMAIDVAVCALSAPVFRSKTRCMRAFRWSLAAT